MAGGTSGVRGGATVHGHSKAGARSREFRCWLSMRRRCLQKPEYVNRGITVCARWRDSFTFFIKDMGPAPSDKHTLDRYPDPNGNYEPGNVRWATMLEQRHNRRPDARVGRPMLGKKNTVPQGPDGRFMRKAR